MLNTLLKNKVVETVWGVVKTVVCKLNCLVKSLLGKLQESAPEVKEEAPKRGRKKNG